jgi:anti-sigma-K factor RskA
LRRRLALWRGAALASGAVALVVAVIGGQLSVNLDREKLALADAGRERDELIRKAADMSAQMRAMPDIQYVAVLADERQAPMLLATFDARHNMLTLRRVARVEPSPDRSFELWALSPGAAPHSLGTLGDDAVLRLNLPQLPMNEAPALAVSLEPKGGAPQGSGPTGPVMYKGALLRTAL